MQHEPIGDDDNSGEETKLSDWTEVDEQPYGPQQGEISQRGEGDCRADFAQA